MPAARGREGVADTNPLAAGAVLISPYFYSFGTACTHHGLTEQVFSEVYLACQVQRRTETIRDKRYVFVHVPDLTSDGHSREIHLIADFAPDVLIVRSTVRGDHEIHRNGA